MTPTPARSRVAREETGFTLVELLMVITILGILLAISVPAYLGLQDRANRSSAETAVRSLVADVELYFSDHGTFSGISIGDLKSEYDASIDTTSVFVTSEQAGDSFMMCSKVGQFFGFKEGPAAFTTSATTAPADCTL
jgi:prepilin-type N-terminal cleavage/methylation domain-containing protein